MTLFRGTVLDTPQDPFAGGALRAEEDGGLLVVDGAVVERGVFAELRGSHPDDEVVDLRGGLVLPGFVDTHVHFPQVRAVGKLGLPLLDWLEHHALPEEARSADPAYATELAAEFTGALVEAGTTTALVFGAHFAPAVDALFARADRVGLRITAGLVVGDRLLRDDLHTSPQRAYDEGLALALRWHGSGRLRYAVTPRFSLASTNDLLASSGALLRDVPDMWFTSHVNENIREVETVGRLFDGSHYVGTYDKHGLLGRRSVLAHNVHPTDAELETLADRGSSVAHCPTSNSALGSGLFPLRRHLDHGVRVALGSDVGAGTGFCLLKEGLQAYFMQQLLGPDGVALSPAHLLHLATSAGAVALELQDVVGDLSPGKRFDAVWVHPRAGTAFDVALRHAMDAEDAVSKAFAFGTASDVAGVWIDGVRVGGPVGGPVTDPVAAPVSSRAAPRAAAG